MKPQTLLRLYPRRWRERYGDEFSALLEQEGMRPRIVLNVMAGAFDAWMSPRNAALMAIEGPFRLSMLFRRADLNDRIYSRQHLAYLVVAVWAGKLLRAATLPLHGGAGELAFTIYFSSVVATYQFWMFRRFSLRTRLAAVTSAFLLTAGAIVVVIVLLYFLHRWLHP